MEEQDPRVGVGTPIYRRAMIALFCAGVATFAQLYSPQGLLPEIARDYGVSAGMSSWTIGAATIGVAIGVLPWARLSDLIGRVRAMRAALIAAMLIGLLAPWAPTIETMLAIRLIEGIALAGLPATAVTSLSETIHPRVLGVAVGSYVAGTTLGGLAGRIVAGLVADPLGWRWGMGAVALLASLMAIVFVFAVPPTLVKPVHSMSMLRATLENMRTPGVAVLVLYAFLVMGAFVATYNYLAFRLEQDPFGLSVAQVSWLFLAYLSGTVASRRAWRLTRYGSPTAVMLWCLGVMIAGLALTLVTSLVLVIVGLVVFTGAFFAAHTIASGLLPLRAGAARSQAPPLYNLGYYAGSSLLGWLGGVAFAHVGWPGTAGMVALAAVLAGVSVWWYAAANGGSGKVDAI